MALGLALTAPAASALEAMKLYDNFTSPSMSARNWPGAGERLREISNKRLHMRARDFGLTTSNTGSVGANFNQSFADPSAVTAIQATMIVNNIEAVPCASNPVVTSSRARLIASFFNVATPTQGSQVNDVTSQLRLMRNSDATSPAGTMSVQGLVLVCTDSTCINTTTIGVADLGTATLGQAVVGKMQWDKPNKRFLFSRDGGTAIAVTYTQSDTQLPGLAFANLSTRTIVPSCTTTPAPSGMVDVSFDNVNVNKSALP